MRIGELSVSTGTGPTGSPILRVSLPVAADEEGAQVATETLDRREVEELRDTLEEWLQ